MSVRILSISLALLPVCQSLSMLVLHPYLSGSHVLGVHSISKKMLTRGHSVTLVKFHEGKLPPFSTHPNLTIIDLFLDNLEGDLKFVEKTRFGEFRYPMDAVWSKGRH